MPVVSCRKNELVDFVYCDDFQASRLSFTIDRIFFPQGCKTTRFPSVLCVDHTSPLLFEMLDLRGTKGRNILSVAMLTMEMQELCNA